MIIRLRKHMHGFIDGLIWIMTNSILPHTPSKNIRNFGLRCLGANITKNVKFYSGFTVRNPKGLTIEDGVSVGPKVLLDARCGLTIRKNAVLAYDAIIWSLNHDYNDVHFCGKGAHVEIGPYAWICSRSIVLPGVKIGKGEIVASGAIVTKDVEPFTIVGGIPAKKIGVRERKDYQYGYDPKNDFQHFI